MAESTIPGIMYRSLTYRVFFFFDVYFICCHKKIASSIFHICTSLLSLNKICEPSDLSNFIYKGGRERERGGVPDISARLLQEQRKVAKNKNVPLVISIGASVS